MVHADGGSLAFSGLRASYTLRDSIEFVVTNTSSATQIFYCEGEIFLHSMGDTWQPWEYRVEDNKRDERKITYELRPGESREFAWKPRMGWSSAPATLRLKLVAGTGEPRVTYSREFMLHRTRKLPTT